jgi:CubicO group peptidase (beta-lactamase class C family)
MRKEECMHNTEIDALIREQVDSNGPGVAVAIIKDGQVDYCQGYGLANLEWEIPITPQTVFGLGSITKQFTATAIMLLEKQGKLHLDDPIQTYLPGYPTHGRHVTLTHLLTHTAGISNFVTNPGFWGHHSLLVNSVDDVIALFKDLPFDFEPGTWYGYSNSGYVLLGHILEKLLGMSYAEVIQQLIFTPLGMTHSYDLAPEPIIPSRADGYTKKKQGYEHARAMAAIAKHAAGGLGSTLEDMIRWDSALRENRLLDHALQERMYAPLQLVNGHKEDYGLGWTLGHYRGHDVLCHGGGVPGFSAFFGRFVADGVTIIVLSNLDITDAFGLAAKIAYRALDAPSLTRTPVSLDPQALKGFVGAYDSIFGTQDVREDEGMLYLADETIRHTLMPISETSFYRADDEDTEVRFENPNEQGIYRHIRVIYPFAWLTAERCMQ